MRNNIVVQLSYTAIVHPGAQKQCRYTRDMWRRHAGPVQHMGCATGPDPVRLNPGPGRKHVDTAACAAIPADVVAPVGASDRKGLVGACRGVLTGVVARVASGDKKRQVVAVDSHTDSVVDGARELASQGHVDDFLGVWVAGGVFDHKTDAGQDLGGEALALKIEDLDGVDVHALGDAVVRSADDAGDVGS